MLKEIIKKKIEKVDLLKKSISLNALNEQINQNKTFINFKDKIQNNIDNNKISLIVDLKYYEGIPVIKEIKRVSKPGRRVFSRADSIPRIQNGLGLAIISTNKGVMSDIEARKNNVGGEIICRVF